MPEMDGLTATQKIREGEAQGRSRIPIIAVTAHAMKGDRERCVGAGMDGYITKPINGRALEEAIAAVVPGRHDSRLAQVLSPRNRMPRCTARLLGILRRPWKDWER